MPIHYISVLTILIAVPVLFGCNTERGREVGGELYTVTVNAGEFDRKETVVSFLFPDKVEQGIYRMTGTGDSVYVQVDDNSKARFVLDYLEAGESNTYQLLPEPITDYKDGISSQLEERTVAFEANGSGVFHYYHTEHELPEDLGEAYRRGGYLYPVKSPGGSNVTGRFDEGLPHQYGIFSAWTSTEFEGNSPDFWNIQDETGTVINESLDEVWEGPVYGGFRARHGYIDLTGATPRRALNEQWEVYTYRGGKFHILDLKVTQSANYGKPLVLPQYHYGGVAIRGNEAWIDSDTFNVITSGSHNRQEANEERVRWVHMGGELDGDVAGVAQMQHPDNIRHPQPVRVHPDEPYFVFTPMQLGKITIEPGAPLVLKYRFVVHDDQPEPDKLDRIWNDFAYPPGVTVRTD